LRRHRHIQAVGPDELLALGSGYVDLLKVDIEGAGVELFRPDPRWLDHVGAVVIELHDDTPFGPAREPGTAVLRTAGFVTSTSGEFTVEVRPEAHDGADQHEAVLARSR
jgi:hypothetical protein